ncbi:adenylyltransferase/cytidyltransferase family protein [Vibrio parahaemolyticus]|uniref:adenylyltransferase/cytidyltransferase family protein n=1 Tax=Vibrio parahaemolyticus TaxID=670 RepID=UPI0008FC4AB2|nr:adenylyltransferase/cytidyltransferase family protein [Vibrio parahaemolyticus]APC87711.1 glycerol-3-phosphate cytidylyltransferase [Vibrio parahaemolyticus]EHR5480205.1 adenylyltransferase/cytidyltransferase family protein [Vibrio parahaemolyticus]
MIIGYTSGVFDILHIGHENFLQACKRQCDILYVGVDSDTRVKRLKGTLRPVNPETTRVKNVSQYCDYAFIKWKASHTYLETIQPDIIFESSEKRNSTVFRGFKGKYIKIPYTKEISTTKLITLAPCNINA